MNRPFALLVCLPVIWWLWKRDVEARPQFSRALWIPLFWVFVLGSRPLSWWLGVGGSTGGDLEGNWFDRLLYLGLIFAAICVLSRRAVSWSALIHQNKALFLFYGFLLLTILWAPFPFVGFKRWFKDFGAIFIILLILTEEEPLEAAKAIFARCAYVWFPLSEILAKYFPDIGREYSKGGFATYCGVTTQKNSLGEIILVAGLIFLSELVQPNRPLRGRFLRKRGLGRFFEGHHLTILIGLAMGVWLLLLSNSKTSLICFVVGSVIVLGYKMPFFRNRPGRLLTVVVGGTLIFFMADKAFQASGMVYSAVNRDATLTQRTHIWEAIEENPVDPIFGSGYMMYWDLHRGVGTGEHFYDVKTAHNGYLEMYLDGGRIGLCFLTIMLLGMGAGVIRGFLASSEKGILAFAFLAVTLLYNISESMFARRSPLWFAFLLFGLNCRGLLPSTAAGETEFEEADLIDLEQPVRAVAQGFVG